MKITRTTNGPRRGRDAGSRVPIRRDIEAVWVATPVASGGNGFRSGQFLGSGHGRRRLKKMTGLPDIPSLSQPVPDPYHSGSRPGARSFRVPLHRGPLMLLTIAIILLILWLLGMVSSYTFGGFLHILLILAIIVFLVRVITGRRPV